MQPFRFRVDKIRHTIFLQFFLVAAVFWAFHWISPGLVRHFNIRVHINSKTVPLFGSPDFDFNRWMILPLIAFGVYLFLLRTVLNARHPIPLPILLALAMGLKVMIDISVTLINGEFLPPANHSGVRQYFADVPKFQGIGDILRNYTDKAHTLTIHSGTHPPGPVLSLWMATRLFGYDRMVKAFMIILTAPLSIVPLYLMAKRFFDEKVALYSIALYLVTPNIVLLTATCMDAFFAIFLISSTYLFFRSVWQKSIGCAVLTGISLSLSMLLTFATTFLGVYFIGLTILIYLAKREEFRNYLTMLLVSGGTFCVVYLFLYWTTGYNLLACIRGAVSIDEKGSLTHPGLGTGYETFSRYLFLSAINLFAFFIGIGIPTMTLWFREVGDTVKKAFIKEAFPVFLLAYVVVLIVIAFSTLYTTETERIWMFMAPFILIPAAANLKKLVEAAPSERLLYAVIVLLFSQTVALEVFMDTLW